MIWSYRWGVMIWSINIDEVLWFGPLNPVCKYIFCYLLDIEVFSLCYISQCFVTKMKNEPITETYTGASDEPYYKAWMEKQQCEKYLRINCFSSKLVVKMLFLFALKQLILLSTLVCKCETVVFLKSCSIGKCSFPLAPTGQILVQPSHKSEGTKWANWS